MSMMTKSVSTHPPLNESIPTFLTQRLCRLSLPLLNPVRDQVCGMRERHSQAVRGDQPESKGRMLAS